jgi:kynurenine formamidase
MRSYDDLLSREDAPPGSTWGLFGPGDELGMVNHLTPERVVRSASLVRRGRVFNLDLPVGAFHPSIGVRTAPRHTVFSNASDHRDDVLDGFFLQGTTQVDGLRHFKHPVHGFYNGADDEQIQAGDPTLGVNRLVDHGMVGRGVLLDMASYLAADGRPIDPAEPTAFTVEDLDAAADAQSVALEPGDMVLLRTGWLRYLLDNPEFHAAQRESMCSTGLAQSEATLRWLWDHRVSLLAADNLGVEVLPPVPDSPFRTDPDLADLVGHHVGMAHPVIIGLLGLPLGELWWLDDLAEDCRRDGVWDFMLTVHPLNVVGGVGAPANATAIK